MKAILVLLALVFASPALAEASAVCPPAQYSTKRPVPGERIVAHKSAESFLDVCDKRGDLMIRGEIVLECVVGHSINAPAPGVWGATVRSFNNAVEHGRAHLMGWPQSHPGARFCP